MTTAERSVWRPLLGIAFSDAATGLAVRDGLKVTARLGRSTHTFVRSLNGAGWALASDREPPPAEVPVRIEDPAGRYLPAVAALPAGVTPLGLASAPGRAVPAGHAQVRATLRDRATGAPLAGMRLRVTIGGRTSSGYSDERGEVLVCLPWPKTPPNLAGTLPLADRTWPAVVTAQAPTVAPPPGGAPFAIDLGATYASRVIAAAATGADALPEQTLRYGRPLVLVSEGAKALLIV